MDLRLATRDDIPAMAALLAQLGYPAAPDMLEDRLAALAASPFDDVYVAVIDDAIVGCMSLHATIPLHTAGLLGRISAMVVDAEHRGTGVGRALVDEALVWCRDKGCTRVEVTSAQHREGAHRFYEALGFRNYGRRFLADL